MISLCDAREMASVPVNIVGGTTASGASEYVGPALAINPEIEKASN